MLVRGDQASLAIPSGINSPETKKCRLTHKDEGKDANIQAPNPKAIQHILVPEGTELRVLTLSRQTGTLPQTHRNNEHPL